MSQMALLNLREGCDKRILAKMVVEAESVDHAGRVAGNASTQHPRREISSNLRTSGCGLFQPCKEKFIAHRQYDCADEQSNNSHRDKSADGAQEHD
jgi:hypothetical protein